MKRVNKQDLLLALGFLTIGVLAFPSTAYADHPGIIGPVTHLGVDTVIRVVLAALLDGVNPTAFGVLLFVCYRAQSNKSSSVKKQGFLFLAGLLTTYLAAGVVLRLTYSSFGPSIPIQIFQILIAGLLFMSGLQELIQAIKPEGKRLVTLPKSFESILARFDKLSARGLTFVLGLIVGVLELFATGAIYLSFIQAVTYDPTAPWWVSVATMAIYLTAFLIPLLLAYSYRNILVGNISDKNMVRARRARGITGVVFMIAALFIAASSIVTIQAIGTNSSSQDNQTGMNNQSQTKQDIGQLVDYTSNGELVINISDYRYDKPNIKIKKGTTVTWVNQDMVQHNVMLEHEDDDQAHNPPTRDKVDSNKLAGPLLANGESYSFTFNQISTNPYHCSPHPYMVGSITVVE